MESDLLRYIKQSRVYGVSDTQIRNTLLRARWPIWEVERAFAIANSSKSKAPSSNLVVPLLFIVSGVLVIAATLFFSFQPNRTPTLSGSPNANSQTNTGSNSTQNSGNNTNNNLFGTAIPVDNSGHTTVPTGPIRTFAPISPKTTTKPGSTSVASANTTTQPTVNTTPSSKQFYTVPSIGPNTEGEQKDPSFNLTLEGTKNVAIIDSNNTRYEPFSSPPDENGDAPQSPIPGVYANIWGETGIDISIPNTGKYILEVGPQDNPLQIRYFYGYETEDTAVLTVEYADTKLASGKKARITFTPQQISALMTTDDNINFNKIIVPTLVE